MNRTLGGFAGAAVASLATLALTLRYRRFPGPHDDPLLDLIAAEDPTFHAALRVSYFALPALAVLALGSSVVTFRESLVPRLRRARRLAVTLCADLIHRGRAAYTAFLDRFSGFAGIVSRLLTWRFVIALLAALVALLWSVRTRHFPPAGSDPLLDLIAVHDPGFHAFLRVYHLTLPPLLSFVGVLSLSSGRRLWLDALGRPNRPARGSLPPWPTSTEDSSPSLVVGETHHPVENRETSQPQWLTIPERGLYTGVAIFGAIGTGKTSACMHPFATQLLSWQAHDPNKRAAALVLEVKGDFCHDIHAILEKNDRAEDYIELALGGRWQWNPLSSDMDSYSLAYTVGNLLNQLFGKSKEPFWQAAYTNLLRWLIELHRSLPEQWVTFQDLYACALDADLIAAKLEAAATLANPEPEPPYLSIAATDLAQHAAALGGYAWRQVGDTARAPDDVALLELLQSHSIKTAVIQPAPPETEHAKRILAIRRWFEHDWLKLDTKLQSSIVESVSVFLSTFDTPEVARVFCPPKPRPPEATPAGRRAPPLGAPAPSGLALLRPLPDIGEMIEAGRVIALNMPAGANAALSRTIGVMLKNAWLQALLKRPAAMKANPRRYFRPAVFLCDEYQSFATVGEDDPTGDEKSFALTRQCRVIPIVATQSISSLKSVLSGTDAWRTLLQTLRTRIFLAVSDDATAEQASTMCGKILRLSPSYTISENASKPGFSLLTGRATAGKGSLGTSKSFRENREPLFHPRSFTLLENCQAIALTYDGVTSRSATRVYLKPSYLPRVLPYWRARDANLL